MTDYDDTNQGVLFKNDKEGNEKRPDYTGKVNVNGEEFRLAAWIRTGKNTGNKFMSLKVSEPNTDTQTNTGDVTNDPELNDDLPF